MVNMYACFETSKLHRKIRDHGNNRKGEMTATGMTQRHRSAERYFFNFSARLLCSRQFSRPGRVAAVDAGINY